MTKDAHSPIAQQDNASSGKPVRAEWMDSLNEIQQQAVDHVSGACLILAGAGTGKTRTLVSRFANIVYQKKATADEILCVTFTNKAANEMKYKIANLTACNNYAMWVGTFHSLCLKILRNYPELVGLKPNFTILDASDQKRLLKDVLVDLDIDVKTWSEKELIEHISRLKDRAIMPNLASQKEFTSIADGKLIDAYFNYQARLKFLNAVDFGDLIMLCIELFKDNSSVLKKYTTLFRYILVDEYQDTNVAQYKWLKLLTSANAEPNICCVGDDDQSIYGWRGAEIGNILNFEKDFKAAKIIKLEQNYRSTGHILACAARIISHNQSRFDKTIFTASKDGEKVSLVSLKDGYSEARFVAKIIEAARKNGQSLSQIAILVRSSFQTREFEEKLFTAAIPYKVIGGARFYEREEIRDAVAFLRVIHKQSDDMAFERIINKPARGVGKATIAKLKLVSRAQSIFMFEAAEMILKTDELATRAKNALGDAMGLLSTFIDFSKDNNYIETLKMALDKSGYIKHWADSNDIKAPSKVENLSELLNALKQFENTSEFLEHIALAMEGIDDGQSDMLSIMTIHASKGLEFDWVFLPGWEDRIFPNDRALEQGGSKALEEERRLAYVGITRAKKKCYILFVKNRFVHGNWIECTPSIFINEISGANTNIVNLNSNSLHIPNFNNSQRTLALSKTKSKFSKAERCFHQKFGMGTVEAVSDDYLVINFDSAKIKKVMSSFVEKVKDNNE